MTEEVWKEILQRFIDRRVMLGMSQAEVARRAGLTQPTISVYEGGRKLGVPDHPTVVKWARGLRLTVKVGIYLTCPEYTEPYFADITPED